MNGWTRHPLVPGQLPDRCWLCGAAASLVLERSTGSGNWILVGVCAKHEQTLAPAP